MSSQRSSQSAHAYTPGLRISELYRFRKTRRLPLPGEVLVNKGDKVNYHDIVARTNLPGDIQIISAAAIFGC